jgi:hypothetical protein
MVDECEHEEWMMQIKDGKLTGCPQHHELAGDGKLYVRT